MACRHSARLTGRKDQWRAASNLSAAVPLSGHTAPSSIQRANAATVSAGNESSGGISSSSSAGSITWTSRLCAALPGTIAAPWSPPANSAARESTRSQLLVFSPPWHLKHLPTSTGRIRVSKCCSAAGVAATTVCTANTASCDVARKINTRRTIARMITDRAIRGERITNWHSPLMAREGDALRQFS